MGPWFMTLLLVVGWSLFFRAARRRWKLMMVGAAESRTDNVGERLKRTWTYGVAQLRMGRYPIVGFAHMLIFAGFGVLLLRTLILWGRGFDESFSFGIFGDDWAVGRIYSFLKDIFAVLVLIGALVFLYYRVIKRPARMTLSTEGLIILWIIVAMMLADILYDGATIARYRTLAGQRQVLAPIAIPNPEDGFESKEVGFVVEDESPLASGAGYFVWYEPAGSLAGMVLSVCPDGFLTVVKHLGFWTHSALVLIFLNLLPYSKHFHVITAIPNVYAQSLHPPGRLVPIEDIEGKVEREETLGIKRIDQFSWKSILDFYTCTECGRCSDHCPATKTGKKLSPKHFGLDLRDFLYKHENALVAAKAAPSASGGSGDGESGNGGEAEPLECHKDLVGPVIDPEVLWACTSCRACETECPVFITFVDKITDMRRYLVQEKGEFPSELQTAFRSLESTANPWGFPAEDRAAWAEGLNVKTIAEHPEAEYLFWIGCAPSYDERAKKVTRATVKLFQKAGVDFAILGTEEQCTGDPARRAGNEHLYQMFAKANVEVMNAHGVEKKKIVAICPHCFNTLANEYGDFGGHYTVVHHTTLLAELVREGKLKPEKRIDKRIVYHDSCYLGRYNEIYDAPRETLKSIPGLTVLEPAQTRDRGMCCGAGGAQMFKEEESGDMRVNALRTEQLLDTKPDMIASACPFCTRMLTDGLADKGREDVPQLDIAEVLWEAMGEEEAREEATERRSDEAT